MGKRVTRVSGVVPAPPIPGQRWPSVIEAARVTGFATFTEPEGRR